MSLILSTSLFTQSPLYGMDEEEKEGLGAFHILPQDALIKTLQELDVPDVGAMRRTSKPMGIVCEAPEIWAVMARRRFIKMDPTMAPKVQVQEFYNLFTDPNKTYILPMQMIEYFKQTQIFNHPLQPANPTPGYEEFYHAYSFKIGRRTFNMVMMLVPPIKFSLLDEDEAVTFAAPVQFHNLPNGVEGIKGGLWAELSVYYTKDFAVGEAHDRRGGLEITAMLLAYQDPEEWTSLLEQGCTSEEIMHIYQEKAESIKEESERYGQKEKICSQRFLQKLSDRIDLSEDTEATACGKCFIIEMKEIPEPLE